MKLIFATHNQNKLIEVQSLISPQINLLSLNDINWKDEIEETEATIEGNALLKAKTVYAKTQIPCFSDDSGLLVDCLNGAPGVYSARYGGEQKNDNDNIARLLKEMHHSENRNAHFKTVLALVIDNEPHLFEGIVHGTITLQKTGTNGFGYDPVFLPDNYNKTFAEMSSQEKNAISHRAIALRKMTDYLTKILNK